MNPPRRCLLFVPGARPERFGKALAVHADQVCIDLEDAVGLADKAGAREAAIDFILSAPSTVSEIGVRINIVSSDLGRADLKRIVERAAKPAFIMLPKTENAADVQVADQMLAGTDIGLIALLESPHAAFEARNIAAASKRVQALMFGGFDYAVAAREGLPRLGEISQSVEKMAHALTPEIGSSIAHSNWFFDCPQQPLIAAYCAYPRACEFDLDQIFGNSW